MADSKQYDYTDLTECGICLCTIEEPKALPCLHSYCLKCLTRWAKDKTDIVRCPICNQDFSIPSDGIKGFRTNFFINTLKERQATAEKLQSKDAVIPCTSCGAVGQKAEAHCTTCAGFICGECVAIHSKVKGLDNHKVIPFEDLQSGKVETGSLSQKKYCKIHEGQVLRFCCETCGILICRDCTVVDHSASSHVLVNLESATEGQREEIEQLIQDCDERKKKVKEISQEVANLSEKLERNAASAKTKIDKSFKSALKLLEETRNCLKEEVEEAVSERKKQLDAQKDDIELQQTRLQTTLQVATEVTQTGSDYDLALVFSSLKSNLTQLRDVKSKSPQKHFVEIQFKPTHQTNPSFGSLTIGCGKEEDGVWKLVKIFGTDGTGKLHDGRGVTVTPNGDIVAADSVVKTSKIYTANGNFKSVFTTNHGGWDVVNSADGRLFVTQQMKHVNVYDNKGTFKHQFATWSPSNVSSDTHGTSQWGITLDNQNNLLVGEVRYKYISKHQLDGTHISSFNVTIKPCFIAVTPQDTILISCALQGEVDILNQNGVHLHSLKPPQGVSWGPYGLCCTSENEVYIANWNGGIHCFSTVTYDYLGCITEDVTNPAGLALMEDEGKLVVAENKGVKIFSLQ